MTMGEMMPDRVPQQVGQATSVQAPTIGQLLRQAHNRIQQLDEYIAKMEANHTNMLTVLTDSVNECRFQLELDPMQFGDFPTPSTIIGL